MRQPITLKIKFKSASLDQFIERYSVDVSRGGIFIRTKEPLAVGTQLKFEFQLQDSSALISGEGTVTWIREHDPNRTGVAPGMGVRFDKLASASGGVLDQILTEKSRRGEGSVESRFDAGVRASATASGQTSQPHRVSDFDAVDSKAMTPLPNPMPGFDSAEGEFGQESTRVMQDDVVQRLAERTRSKPPVEEEAFSDEPTRARSAEELADLARSSSGPIALGDEMLDRTNVDEKRRPGSGKQPVISSAPPPPVSRPIQITPASPPTTAPPARAASTPPQPVTPAEPPPALPLLSNVDSAPMDVENTARSAPPLMAEALPLHDERPTTRKKSSSLPLVLGVGMIAAAAVGYVVLSGGTQTGGGTNPPVVGQPTDPASAKTADPEQQPGEKKGDAPQVAQNDKNDKMGADPAPEPDKKGATPAADAPKGPSVAIASEPAGGTVFIDGKERAQTPLTLTDLEAKKTYEVKVALKGYREFKTTLVAKDGAKVEAKLVANEKVVEVISKPAGADLFLDGKKIGRTPYAIRKFDVGKEHQVELRHGGFLPQTRKVSADDAWEPKPEGRDVLALALTLEAEPVRAPRPVVRKPPGKKPDDPPTTTTTTTTVDPPAVPVGDKPVTDKPVGDKPVGDKPPADKPVADKPEKPAEKPAAKPADKPEDDKAIKTPAWMKGDKPEGEAQ